MSRDSRFLFQVPKARPREDQLGKPAIESISHATRQMVIIECIFSKHPNRVFLDKNLLVNIAISNIMIKQQNFSISHFSLEAKNCLEE
jgi:hypothetical protein